MNEKTKKEIDEECLEIAREFWRADFRRRVNIIRYFLFGEEIDKPSPKLTDEDD